MKRKDDQAEVKRSIKENNSNAEEAYRGKPQARGAYRGRGGRGDYNGEFRGRGDNRGRGSTRGEFRGDYRGANRARGRGAPYRGARGGYSNQRVEEPQYQSNDEGEISDGPEPLTANEIAFIDERIAENKDKLQGIVNVSELTIFIYNIYRRNKSRKKL